MAPRQMKMPEKTEAEPEEKFSQRKRLVRWGVSSFKSIGKQKAPIRRQTLLMLRDLRSRMIFHYFTSPYMTASSMRARR